MFPLQNRILVEVVHQTIGDVVDEIGVGDGTLPNEHVLARHTYVVSPRAFLSETDAVWMYFYGRDSVQSSGSFSYQFSTFHEGKLQCNLSVVHFQ